MGHQKSKTAGVGIVCSTKQSAWVSCRSIVPNLRAAYQQSLGKKARLYDFGPHMVLQISRLALQIFKERPSHLIFIDHQPHPEELLRWLREVYGSEPLPKLLFHIFGDFTYFAPKWMSADPVLRAFDVHFICASQRQARLLSRFLAGESNLVSICPFPVDTDVFRFDEGLRASWREQHGIKKQEKVICYTGRLSLQKNVTRLIREFANLSARQITRFIFLSRVALTIWARLFLAWSSLQDLFSGISEMPF